MRVVTLLLLLSSVASAQSLMISSGPPSILISGSGESIRPPKPAEKPERPSASAGSEVLPVPVFREEPPAPRPAAHAATPPKVAPATPELHAWTIQNCPPCNQFKSDCANRVFEGLKVIWRTDGANRPNSTQGYPQFQLGSRSWVGYGPGTRDDILRLSGTSSAPVQPAPVTAAPVYLEQPQLIRDQWGTYNPETYGHCGNASCTMCNSRAAMRRSREIERGRWQSAAELPEGQQPLPMQTVRELIQLLHLTPQDILADLGCGDARILIEAVRQSGCRAIGVEIDPLQAERARKAVADSGMTDRIVIAEGDARMFCPRESGVTVITAYLFADLLAELAPVFSEAELVAAPFHPIPGLPSEQIVGEFFLYHPRKEKA